MGGEPWAFTPAEIGALTDRQIWEVYVRPAVRRARGPRAPRAARGRADALPTRDEYVELGAAMGIPAEHSEREYDRWAASEEGRRELAKAAATNEAT